MVPRTKESVARAVPYSKGKIAKQVLDTLLSPSAVSPQQQLDVSHFARYVFASCGEFINQVCLSVHTRVGNDPDISIQSERLVLARRFLCSPEQRMTEANTFVRPHLLRVWTSEGHEMGHLVQKPTVNRSAVQIENAYDAAH